MFCYVTPATILLITINKKGPGGYLIRVDLIRFPGSIPGATQMCALTDVITILGMVSTQVSICELVVLGGIYS